MSKTINQKQKTKGSKGGRPPVLLLIMMNKGLAHRSKQKKR